MCAGVTVYCIIIHAGTGPDVQVTPLKAVDCENQGAAEMQQLSINHSNCYVTLYCNWIASLTCLSFHCTIDDIVIFVIGGTGFNGFIFLSKVGTRSESGC